MQGWRNTMEDSHISKVLDDTPGKILPFAFGTLVCNFVNAIQDYCNYFHINLLLISTGASKVRFRVALASTLRA
jgi:hypothetical protein